MDAWGRRAQTLFECATRGLRCVRKGRVDYARSRRCLPRRRGLTSKRMAFRLGYRAALATGSSTASVVAWRLALRKWHRPPQKALNPLSQLTMLLPRHVLRLPACAFPSHTQALPLFCLAHRRWQSSVPRRAAGRRRAAPSCRHPLLLRALTPWAGVGSPVRATPT